jgi:hypothetical protein
MTDEDATPAPPLVPDPAKGPLVFISHDSRDAELAGAFAKLLNSVSAGMIKTFHSSDKSPGGGIEYGDEWYKRLMERLSVTTDVVCLFTARSLDRPWILFEAGVAKGKLDTPVVGLALGVPLNRVSSGPFYQFQNMPASDADLKKLLAQLAQRVDGLALDDDVVTAQIEVFLSAVDKFGEATDEGTEEYPQDANAAAIATLSEEMKALPNRVAERVGEVGEGARGSRRPRVNPRVFNEIIDMAMHLNGDPALVLIAASLVREDLPWLYEPALDTYRAMKTGKPGVVRQELKRIRTLGDMAMRGPLLYESGMLRGRESEMLAHEWPRFFEELVMRSMEFTPNSEEMRRSRGASVHENGA